MATPVVPQLMLPLKIKHQVSYDMKKRLQRQKLRKRENKSDDEENGLGVSTPHEAREALYATRDYCRS
ncbi:uncharacterized protein DFL_009289 [Arthrobotrys flagrans]|uniref:Uncharacterized protein n=1 Tax=Arthrobotrys flagrans TaxID=97331 RepID=A0A436ZRC6_ARTFL|nr:hypothetical protein DFL_009289 [Arthrobotrys flagrans]